MKGERNEKAEIELTQWARAMAAGDVGTGICIDMRVCYGATASVQGERKQRGDCRQVGKFYIYQSR